MAIAITDRNLWLLAFQVVEDARFDGLPVSSPGSVEYRVEVAEVVVLLARSRDLPGSAQADPPTMK